MKRTLLAGALALTFTGAAQADIIPTFVSTTPVAGGTDYTYRAVVTQEERAVAGDFFTLYDFFGFTGVTSTAAGFVGSTALVGPTPPGVVAPDSATITNVTFTRTGAAVVGPSDLGLFTIRSTSGILVNGSFTAQATRNGGLLDGTKIANVGLNSLPLPGVIPEPSTMLLLGAGLVGLFAIGRKRLRV